MMSANILIPFLYASGPVSISVLPPAWCRPASYKLYVASTRTDQTTAAAPTLEDPTHNELSAGAC